MIQSADIIVIGAAVHLLTVRMRRVVLTFLPASFCHCIFSQSKSPHHYTRVSYKGPRNGGLGAIFVCRYGWGGEGGGIVEFFIVCPVWAAVGHVSGHARESRERRGYLAILDMVTVGRWMKMSLSPKCPVMSRQSSEGS